MEQAELELAITAGEALRRRGWTLATAESCTGGLVGAIVTAIAGSSAYYLGGIIAYSNDIKAAQLGVAPEILTTVGAVSAPCAEAMALGVRNRFGTDVAVATTGIAGPGGATPDKPVGLVYVAVATAEAARVEHFHFDGDRIHNQHATVVAALRMVIEVCEQGTGHPRILHE